MTHSHRIVALFVLFSTVLPSYAQKLSPYTLGAVSTESLQNTVTLVQSELKNAGFELIGEYQPANDPNRWLIVVTSEELRNAVQSTGGLTGFALALRVGLTKENNQIAISYTTPAYWGNAYYQKKFEQVKDAYQKVDEKFKTAMNNCGTPKNEPFGSKKGLDENDLRSYKYMIGMPKFGDTIELKSFPTFEDAIKKIDHNISTSIENVQKVYEVSIPELKIKLYGFALSGTKGEEKFLPTIDIGNTKHTAFLPYEILVMNNEVHMLHGRYRIALSFPDLKMVTFTKIMSTPGDIKDLLSKVVE
ncbi:hypothetical protein EP331_02395 [bacterium]|nr:MAG: hypothetical protein EP331_02395 [bacterium]